MFTQRLSDAIPEAIWWIIYNIPSTIPQVGFGEGSVCTTLPLPCEGKEVVSDTPLAQVKHCKIKQEMKYIEATAGHTSPKQIANPDKELW